MYDEILKQAYGITEIKHDLSHDISLLKVPELSPEDDEKVWSTWIWISRNVKDIGHTMTWNNVENLKSIWEKVLNALKKLPAPEPIVKKPNEHFYDEYFSNDAETIQYETKMIWYWEYAWFVSEEDGSIFKAAGCNRDYPEGRAVHYNGHRTKLTYINDEDHIKISCHNHGLNILHHYN